MSEVSNGLEVRSQAAGEPHQFNIAQTFTLQAAAGLYAVALKELLFDLQDSRCAYCQRDIGDEIGKVEIEHILPKEAFGDPAKHTTNDDSLRRHTSGYPHFRFLARNLVLACKRCNQKKGTHDPRRNRGKPAFGYPKSPASFIWVHLHFHEYRDHIKIDKGFVYRIANKSASGDAVIRECKLAGIAAIEIRARERSVKRARTLTKAFYSLAPHVDDWSDEKMLTILQKRFPKVSELLLRRGILELRGGHATAIGKIAAGALA